MKHKFSKILGVVAVIALLASFMVPVSADVSEASVALDDEEISATTTYAVSFNLGKELPLTAACVLDSRGDATATWVTTAPTGYTGTSAAKFTTTTGSWDDMVIAYVEYDQALSTIATEADLSFTYYSEVGAADPFPGLYLDTDDNGVVDYALGGKRLEDQTAGQWVTTGPYVSDAAYPDIWRGGNFTFAGGFTSDDGWHSLAYYETNKPGATVLYVGLEYGDEANAVLYVDKITINNRVYDLEEEPTSHTITITFPEDTVVPAGSLDDATIQASPGWIGGQWENATTTGVTFVGDDEELTVTATLGPIDEIGEGATVRIQVPDITNPDEPGDYTLEVSTSEEDDLVESETYTIEVPEIEGLPGIVEVYNPSNVLMKSYTGSDAISRAIDKADEDWVIKIGPGTYSDTDDDFDTDVPSVTFEAIGDVTWEGIATIDVADVVIDGITFDGDGKPIAVTVTAGGTGVSFEDCAFEDAKTTLLLIDADDITIKDCAFTVEDETGIAVTYTVVEDETTPPEITGSTFTIEEDGEGVGIEIEADTELTDCTFTGGSGVGVEVIAGVSEISDCTFDGLETALKIDDVDAKLDFFGNTIKNCEDIAIIILNGAPLIHNNTITGCNDAVILDVDKDADAGVVFMLFNTITDNAGDDDGLLINNADTENDLYVINNWWGDADGPSQGDDAFSGDEVIREPFLLGPVADSVIAAATEDFDAKDECGVKVASTAGDTGDDMDIVGAASYPENPVGAIDDAIGFWDVCVMDTDEAGDPDSVTIRFYTDVTSDTEVYVWGEAKGEWQECVDADGKPSYTPNLFSGFISVEVGAATSPTLDDLAGLPFVVVEPPEGMADAVEITAPEVGATDVSVTPILAWGAVEDATYEIQITQDATFAILDEAATSPTNAYIVTTALAEGQSYYWRVRAVTDAGAGDWATGVFTTAIPVEPTPPIEIVDQPPSEITVTMPPATITQAIAPGLLWAIIGIGAVLVISLIVLVVRTRRVV